MREPRTVTILHTNDFHNHLETKQARYIGDRKKAAGENVVLVDAGDAISAGNVGVRISGEPILELMNETGYDAMTMGNREFHIADGLLRHKIANATFPILCANIRFQKDSKAALPLVSSVRKIMPNGLRISIVGVTVPMVTQRMSARIISSYLFDDPVQTINRLLPGLRAESDIVIALTHIGIKEDQRLAEQCQGLDLIIGGHSHVVLTEAMLVGEVPIVQAGWFGHYLGQIELSADSHGVKLVSSGLTDIRQVGA